MADKKISALNELLGADIATDDELVIVDKSAGETKRTDASSFASSQTTINMMSKGTVYRFDAIDDVITVADAANILNMFANGGFLSAWVYPKSGGESGVGVGRIVYKRGAGAGYSFGTFNLSGTNVALNFTREAATSDGSYSTGTTLPINTWSHVAVSYDDSDPTTEAVIYINGVAQTLVTSTAPVGAVGSDTGINLYIGSNGASGTNFDGSMGEVLIGNFAPTAAEVKDLVSGNIPFKWQYGSQVDLANGWDFTSGWSAITSTIDDADSFTTTANGGSVRKNDYATEIGRRYKVRIAGTNSGVSGGITDYGGGLAYETWGNGAFDVTLDIVIALPGFLIYGGALGTTTDITIFEVTQLGPVALYDQTSISETTWYDKANGNDGDVIGPTVLNYKGSHTDGTDLYADGKIGIGTALGESLLTLSKTATSGYGQVDEYLHIGGSESGVGTTKLMGFGYNLAARTYTPAYIGYTETSSTGDTKGDLIFGTRDVTSDTQAPERLRIASDGSSTFGGNISIQRASGAILTVENTGNSSALIIVDADRANTDEYIGLYQAKWNGTLIGDLSFKSGSDNINKDEGRFSLRLAAAGGSMVERMACEEDGSWVLSGGAGGVSMPDAGGLSVGGDITLSGTNALLVGGRIASITGPAGTGKIRFANNEAINWRNAGNTADYGINFDASDILTLSGGTGGVRCNDAFGLSVAPQAQQAHIADPTDLATCISAMSTLLADLEGFGLLATS